MRRIGVRRGLVVLLAAGLLIGASQIAAGGLFTQLHIFRSGFLTANAAGQVTRLHFYNSDDHDVIVYLNIYNAAGQLRASSQNLARPCDPRPSSFRRPGPRRRHWRCWSSSSTTCHDRGLTERPDPGSSNRARPEPGGDEAQTSEEIGRALQDDTGQRHEPRLDVVARGQADEEREPSGMNDDAGVAASDVRVDSRPRGTW